MYFVVIEQLTEELQVVEYEFFDGSIVVDRQPVPRESIIDIEQLLQLPDPNKQFDEPDVEM
jgi:hypothetical protein